MGGDILWACLVEHIFSNLALPQDTTTEQIENRQKHILEQIGAKKTLEHKAGERRKELETKRVEAEKKATEARAERDANLPSPFSAFLQVSLSHFPARYSQETRRRFAEIQCSQ
jgi:hypothetical protein